MPAQHTHTKGQRFNKLVALRHVRGRDWEFRCDCGNTTVASIHNVKSGNTKSCGCARKASTQPPKTKTITAPLTVQPMRLGRGEMPKPGTRFGRLVVRELNPDEFPTKGVVPVRCDCGTETAFEKSGLINYRLLACGCLKNEKAHGKGTRFGSLVYQKPSPTQTNAAEFTCDCGTTFVEYVKAVRTGLVRACPDCRETTTAKTDPMEELYWRGVSINNHAKRRGEEPMDTLKRILKRQIT